MHFDHLSDDALIDFLHTRLGDHRRSEADVILVLNEVEGRRLHLEHAYSSMQDFCMRALGMSEDQSFRRLAVARLAQRCPQVIDALASGAVHLCGLVALRDVMNESNADDLLEQAAGMSKRAIAVLVAGLAPKPDVPPSITPHPADAQPALPMNHAPAEKPLGPRASSAHTHGPALTPLSPGRYKIELTASEAFRTKLVRLQELMRHRNPTGDLALDLEAAVDVFLPRLEKQLFAKTDRPRAADKGKKPKDRGVVTAAARRAVFERDGQQCSYVSPHGRRCEARAMLEVDHRLARARGGVGDDVANLRVFCKSHNHLAAEKLFGRSHVAKKIAERRARANAAMSAVVDKAPGVAPKVERSACEGLTRESTHDVWMDDASTSDASTTSARSTVAQALVRLGFRAKEVDRALDALPGPAWDCPIQDLLREALAKLTS